MVCGGTGSQFDGGHDRWVRRCGWALYPICMDAIRLVWHCVRVHSNELLERTATRTGIVAFSRIAALRRARLSVLQCSATCGSLLDLQAVSEVIRHVPNGSSLSLLRGPFLPNGLYRVWWTISDEPMDCSSYGKRHYSHSLKFIGM